MKQVSGNDKAVTLEGQPQLTVSIKASAVMVLFPYSSSYSPSLFQQKPVTALPTPSNTQRTRATHFSVNSHLSSSWRDLKVHFLTFLQAMSCVLHTATITIYMAESTNLKPRTLPAKEWHPTNQQAHNLIKEGPIVYHSGAGVKNPPVSSGDERDMGSSPGWGRSPGVGNGTPSSTLDWKILWTEEPGGLQSMGPQRAGYDSACTQALGPQGNKGTCLTCTHSPVTQSQPTTMSSLQAHKGYAICPRLHG